MSLDIALFTPTVRLALGVVTVVLGLAALLVRRLGRARPRGASEAVGVILAVVALLALTVLAVEQLVGRAVLGAAPDDVAFNEWRWVLAAPWGRVGMGVGIGVAALTLILGALGTRRERLGRRALLIGLRAGACAAALVLFLEPALELRHVTREPNHIAVLVDDSRSMDLAETKGAATRAARAAAIVARSAPVFERWREQHLIDFYSFSDSVLPSSAAQAVKPLPGRGDATLLREALESLRTRYDSHDLAGVVVISDGTPTGRFADGLDDGATQDFLAGLGARVHTVWAGAPGLADLAVSRVVADDFAFVRTAVKVEAMVRATGLPEMDVPVTLRRDGQLVKELTAHVGGSLPDARVIFELVPERVGKYVYEVSVPVLEAEAVAANNSRAFVMRVTRDKTRVLQVSGRPSWDERALRSFFKADPNVDLISFFILRTLDDIQTVSTDELSLIPFPTHELFEEELGSFDVIILQNFEFTNNGIRQYLDNIRAYTEDGGGLAMIGGDLSFSAGGYFGTALADALPVELFPPYESRIVTTEPVAPRLTEDGIRHPITQLRFDRRDNAARWSGLPLLEGLNLVPGVKPGASVLLEQAPPGGSRSGGAKGAPVLVAGDYGKGRTVALLTDSAWRWGFVAAGREGDDGRAYSKLMDNMVRWLIRDPDLDYLRVESDQSEYRKGAPPRLRARLTDKDYKPAAAYDVTIEIVPAATVPAAKNRSLKVDPLLTRSGKTDDAGVLVVEVGELPVGSYRGVARAKLGDRWVTADDVFVVNPAREELEHPAAREDVLAGLARATGGRYLGAADTLAGDLAFTPPRVVRVDRRSDIEIWSRPYLLLLALMFLGAEWALRRRRGFL